MRESEERRHGLGSNKWKSVRIVIYTIEFSELIGFTPVYLCISRTYIADDPVIKLLDGLFPEDETPGAGKVTDEILRTGPEDGGVTSFVVNGDYSISPASQS